MFIISLATAGTVLTLNIYKRGDDEEPVPKYLQTIFFDGVARILFIKIKADRTLDMSVKEMMVKCKKNYFNLNSPENSKIFRKTKIKDETLNTSINQIFEYQKDLFNSKATRNNKLLLKATPYINNHNQKKKKSENFNASNKTLENIDLEVVKNSDHLDDDKFFIASSDISNNKLHRSPESFTPVNDSLIDNQSMINDYERKQFRLVLNALNRNLDKTELRETVNLYRLEIKDQWTSLAKVVDILFLYLFILSTFLMLFIILLQAPDIRLY